MEIEEALDYRFRNADILREALTHKSYHHENPELSASHNERLEFLGDTVLGLIISEQLYMIEPQLTESEMARIKSYLVSGTVLSEIANDLGLGSHIKLGKGEIDTGGREKGSILSDCMEALLGAVYMDGGFDNARQSILYIYGDTIQEALDENKYLDHKTVLQELTQKKYGVLPVYRKKAEIGLEHDKTFTVIVSINGEVMGEGSGPSKKKAETEAAKDALSRIT
ncbi:MAG: ribonuclease III [Nitrospirota bacterium]|nr:MAG: ribonuclease III [Nitrospirota bacterium]